MPKCRSVDIEDKSITQLQNYLVDNVFTSKELIDCYLERIEQLNPYTRLALTLGGVRSMLRLTLTDLLLRSIQMPGR